MRRFLTPVICDHNNNLITHFAYNKEKQLEQILALPGFESYYLAEKKMAPIYLNFFGESSITIALLAHDNQSFYHLLHIFIKMQNHIISSFLVGPWFLKAFEEGLELNALLNSQILSSKLNE